MDYAREPDDISFILYHVARIFITTEIVTTMLQTFTQ